MKVHLKRQNDAVHFVGTNETGNSIDIDGGPVAGGEDKGVRPMQLLLMGIAGCSSIDIVMILKKMRQPIDDLEIIVHADRADTEPKIFTKIELEFIFTGKLKPEKVEKAINLSLDKYCSVSKMLEKTADISYTYSIKE